MYNELRFECRPAEVSQELQCMWNKLYQGSSNLSLEGQSPAVQLQPWSYSPACDFLMILKTLISMLRCVWLGLELNSDLRMPALDFKLDYNALAIILV